MCNVTASQFVGSCQPLPRGPHYKAISPVMPAASKPVCRLLAAQKLTDRALDIQLRLQSGETVFQHAATESHDPWADLFSLIETLCRGSAISSAGSGGHPSGKDSR